ncbi:MAG: FkbM family methyltransferase [Myxococcota bacterium]
MRARARRVVGQLSTPWLYWLGRTLNSSAWIEAALAADRWNVRALEYKAREEGRGALLFAQLIRAAQLSAIAGPGSGAVIKRYLSDSRSQLLQDLVCLLVVGEKRDGFFVEVGVGPGVRLSNSVLLEREFGWRGILVEPNRSFHDSIVRDRVARLDPRAATDGKSNRVTFEENLDDGMYSRIAATHDPAQTSRCYTVNAVKLQTILDEHDAPSTIDYMSIDTEGNELDVLSGLDLAARDIMFLSVEHNFVPGRVDALDDRLLPHGYRRILPEISEIDSWFVHRSIETVGLG